MTKNSNISNVVLVVTLMITSLCSHPVKALSGNQVIALAGGALVVTYCVHTGVLKYHENELARARSAIDPHKGIYYDKILDHENDAIVRATLAKHKEELSKKWIFHYHHGLTLAGSVNFSGRMSGANVYCLALSLYGDGFLKNSAVGSHTTVDGNFVFNSSRLKNTVIIQGQTDFASFDKCVLNDIRQKGKRAVIVELNDTVVDGNIVFETHGFVVMNNTSVISGSVVNGTLVKG